MKTQTVTQTDAQSVVQPETQSVATQPETQSVAVESTEAYVGKRSQQVITYLRKTKHDGKYHLPKRLVVDLRKAAEKTGGDPYITSIVQIISLLAKTDVDTNVQDDPALSVFTE